MKKRNAFMFICSALLCFALATAHTAIFAYLSDGFDRTAAAHSGSVRFSASAFSFLDTDPGAEAVSLYPHAPLAFALSVDNTGISDIDCAVDISLAFDNDLSESGRLALFPYAADDQTIVQNAQGGRFEGALIDIDAPDFAVIDTPSGQRTGIRQTVDSALLDGGLGGGTENDGASFAFKLLFVPDAGALHAYNVQPLHIGIHLSADIPGKATNWRQTADRFLTVRTVTDIEPPVITETPGLNKTFFITQTDGIDPLGYVTAWDNFDGDITERVTVTSDPAFDPGKAGTYTLTYNVSDSAGNAAEPLTVQLVIWDFVKIESGNYHTLALTSHGKVYAWGYNVNGQIGDGTAQNALSPKLVEGLDGIVDIAAGFGSSYALNAEGQTYAWGYNNYGQLGDDTLTAKNRPTAVLQPQGVRFTSISAFYYNAGGLTADGDVYTWGYADYGAAGTGTDVESRTPVKINVSNVKQISLGYYNGAAVTQDGQLYTWGDNYHGQLGSGKPMAIGGNAPEFVPFFNQSGIAVKQVSAGWYHMTAVSETGGVYTWGYGAEGRLGIGTAVDRNTPQQVDLSGAAEALAGYYHTGVRTESGEVYFFGQNGFGKHGTGNATNHTLPVRTPGVSGATSITPAFDSSFILSRGTVVYGMGYGGTGVLGTGVSNDSNIPVAWNFIPPPPS